MYKYSGSKLHTYVYGKNTSRRKYVKNLNIFRAHTGKNTLHSAKNKRYVYVPIFVVESRVADPDMNRFAGSKTLIVDPDLTYYCEKLAFKNDLLGGSYHEWDLGLYVNKTPAQLVICR